MKNGGDGFSVETAGDVRRVGRCRIWKFTTRNIAVTQAKTQNGT
jgi:hypothetical protein